MKNVIPCLNNTVNEAIHFCFLRHAIIQNVKNTLATVLAVKKALCDDTVLCVDLDHFLPVS